jgi:hypothetical protein
MARSRAFPVKHKNYTDPNAFDSDSDLIVQSPLHNEEE